MGAGASTELQGRLQAATEDELEAALRDLPAGAVAKLRQAVGGGEPAATLATSAAVMPPAAGPAVTAVTAAAATATTSDAKALLSDEIQQIRTATAALEDAKNALNALRRGAIREIFHYRSGCLLPSFALNMI